MRTPLAWKNLTSSPGKCLLASMGVGFAVVLMFMQIGFRNALIDNNVQLFTLFDASTAELTILSRARYNISTEQRFPRTILDQAASLPEVDAVCAVNVERGTSSVRVVGNAARPIRVIGVDPITGPAFLRNPELSAEFTEAIRHDSALVDVRTKPDYGFDLSNREALLQQSVELNGQRISIGGTFSLGTDFANDGSLLMSNQLLAEHFPWRSGDRDALKVVDIGLISTNLKSPDALVALASQIQGFAPEQIEVRPTDQFVVREKEFWSQATPIGKIFFIGTLMGLVVGAIICYQIQFTDITEHMPEFATLKAMGYTPAYFWSIVLSQSVYLACLGFIPGLAVSYLLYWLLAETSGLVMSMTWDRILLVWALTLVMCGVSGALAIRKLFGSDPANLF